MKSKFLKSIIVITVMSTLLGCGEKNEEPITDKEESTILTDTSSTDKYLNKQDYKSIAYAYIYNIKEGLKSYESETNGTVRAKVAFFNYDIQYNSVTYKRGNVFYSKDHSASVLSNLDNEFYMVDKEKILVSRDLSNYDVYTVEDYKQISYAPTQYTISGYVFKDESILNAEVVNNKDDVVTIKYTLDNELATNIVKVDFKVNGGLSAYPSFKNIELTLSMHRDFTPISYAIDAVYDASRPFIGTTTVTQHGECLFSKVDGDITIPNETFLLDKLGADPSKIIIDNDEEMKNQLLESVKNLDFATGVNVQGNITLNLFSNQIVLSTNNAVAFDMAKISGDKLYDIFSYYSSIEGNEACNTLISLVRNIAADKLGDFAPVLDNFKKLEIVYDGNGNLYLLPTNQSDVHVTIYKTKVVNVLDLVLQQINVYNIAQQINEDIFDFEKVDGENENSYKIIVTLNKDTLHKLEEEINKLFEDSQYAMIKNLLNYQGLDSLTINCNVQNGLLTSVDASFKYLSTGMEEDTYSAVELLNANFEIKNEAYDFNAAISRITEIYEAHDAILALKERLEYLTEHVYVNKTYLADLQAAYLEYQALSDMQKTFINMDVDKKVNDITNDINNILLFLNTCQQYDLNNLTNQTIYELAKAYKLNDLNSKLLKNEMGEENYKILISLYKYVDYSSLFSAISKLVGDDENSWGLTEQEIRDIKLLLDIANYDPTVNGQIWFDLIMGEIKMTVDTLRTKIDNLYNKL